jgi:hypothetical protein
MKSCSLTTVLAIMVLTVPAVADITVVEDTFTDGGRTNGSDALDVAWYKINESSAGDQTLTVRTDDDIPGIGSGNALEVTHAATDKRRGLLADFSDSEVTLTDLGDWITLELDLRILNDPVTNSARDFRFGLFNNSGTSVVSDLDNDYEADDDQGYFARASTGTEDRWDLTREKGTASFIAGDDLSLILKVTDFGGLADNDTHTAKLILTRAEYESSTTPGQMNPKLDIQFVLDEGTAIEKWLIEDHRGSSAVYSFNEIGFSSHDDDISYIVDNVTVLTNVPEPATIILLGLGGLLAARRRKS